MEPQRQFSVRVFDRGLICVLWHSQYLVKVRFGHIRSDLLLHLQILLIALRHLNYIVTQVQTIK